MTTPERLEEHSLSLLGFLNAGLNFRALLKLRLKLLKKTLFSQHMKEPSKAIRDANNIIYQGFLFQYAQPGYNLSVSQCRRYFCTEQEHI